jgi:RHS repeat-associated protein
LDSFGQVSSQSSGDAADQPSFIYDGMWAGAASATGLDYDIDRWYDAVNGLFVNQDPIGFGGGQTNTEAFCGNSPTNFTDPLGLCDCGCPNGGGAGRAVGLMMTSGPSGGGGATYTPVWKAGSSSTPLFPQFSGYPNRNWGQSPTHVHLVAGNIVFFTGRSPTRDEIAAAAFPFSVLSPNMAYAPFPFVPGQQILHSSPMTFESSSNGLMIANIWPTWLSKAVTVRQIEDMMRNETNPQRLRELRAAKKILQQAARLAQKGPNVRPPRGGRGPSSRCVTPFHPLVLLIDFIQTYAEASESGRSFWDQAQYDGDESIYGHNFLHIPRRYRGDDPYSL